MDFRLTGVLALGLCLIGSVQASYVLEGRTDKGTVDLTCTPHGGLGKDRCVMFYDSSLNVTVLNNWNIGLGTWSSSAVGGSAQKMADDAGFAASGLHGWVLPTGDIQQADGPENQFSSFLHAGAGDVASVVAQFDGVQLGEVGYWTSSTVWNGIGNYPVFRTAQGGSFLSIAEASKWVVAIRPGDVALAVPEPPTYALIASGLFVLANVVRRRKKQQWL